MTVSTAPTPLSYAGNGSTTAFPITWKYNAKSHVVATLRSSAGAETVWALTTNYTLTDPGDSGTLTAVVAPATGTTLVITLEPPNTQSSDIPLGGDFPSTTIEDALDLAAQRDAKIEASFSRCLRVPKTDSQSDSELELPIDSARASKYLAFDSNGAPIASSGTSDTTVHSDFIATLHDDTTAAEARTTLGAVGLTGNETIAGNKTFTGNNIHSGTQTISGVTTISAKSIWFAEGADVASTSDCNIWSAGDGNTVHITGTTTITDWGTAPQAGSVMFVIFDGALQLTYNATTNKLNTGGANYTTEAGDRAIIYAESTSSYIVTIFKIDGEPLVNSGPDIQTFTGSGTWTKPSGFNANCQARLQAWAGGGGGGRGPNVGGEVGGGGGGGSYSERWMSLSSLGATETITIGAGGTGSSGGNGTVGGNTTIGSILTAYGGGPGADGWGGGSAGASGGGGGFLGAGGAASGSTVGTAGSPTYSDYHKGALGVYQAAGNGSTTGGGSGGSYSGSVQNGGASIFGGGGGSSGGVATGGTSVYGGAGGNGTANAGGAGTVPGGGGAGGNSNGSSGGNGAAGKVIITVFS